MWHAQAVFFFKPRTAYEMRISDWSSDVCSSDLLAARLDDGRHRHAGGGQRRDAAVGAVVVGEERDLAARRDAVALDIDPPGIGQHAPRLVVVAEHAGPLDGARRHHHLARADGPVPLARLALCPPGPICTVSCGKRGIHYITTCWAPRPKKKKN